MADTPQVGGASAVDQTGNLTIWFLTAIADAAAPKVADLTAATATRITFDFVPGGWNLTEDQEVNKDERLTIKQPAESLGSSSASLELEYVDSAAANSAAVKCVEGVAGWFVERRNVPQTQTATTGDKVRVIPGVLGKQRPTQPDGTGKFRIKQKVALGVVGNPIALT